jgi:hypothetical protein
MKDEYPGTSGREVLVTGSEYVVVGCEDVTTGRELITRSEMTCGCDTVVCIGYSDPTTVDGPR